MTPADVAAGPADSDLATRLSQLELVLAGGAPHLDRDTRAAGELVLRRAGQRLRLAGDHTVVALAGGTGSGKSTLFNALAGLDLSGTGARRPTTQLPYACVWGSDQSPDLLDWLEVPVERRTSRHSALDADPRSPLAGLVLIDLPDHDSIEVSHWLEVDRLVGLVDALVWVLDPQKYADDSIHERYLRPMSRHADVMIVVLNQIDLLAPGQALACEQDLRRLLADDDLKGVRTMSTSALTGAGVDELRGVLAGAVQSRQAGSRRVSADLAALAPRLGRRAGPVIDLAVVDAAGVDAAAALAGIVGVDALASATQERVVAAGRRRVGWPVVAGRGEVSEPPPMQLSPAEVARVVRAAATQVTAGVGEPVRGGIERRTVDASGDLADRLHTAVRRVAAEPASEPSWWGRLRFVQWGLLGLAVLGTVLALSVSVPVGTLIAVAALAVGWVLGRRAGRSVTATAAARGKETASRLRGDISALSEDRLTGPLRAEIAAHNEVQQALHALAGWKSVE